jgi:uncharacterized protein (UPF0276 family)
MTILQKNTVGLSIKSDYYDIILKQHHNIDFFEAHIENFIAGGYHLQQLKKISEIYPVTLHGVALSLGGKVLPSNEALQMRKEIIDVINPVFISEHAACTFDGQHFNDLLPISLNKQTIKRLVENVDKAQNFFKRQILLENLSSYLAFDDDNMSEADFLNHVSKQSGCGILLDVNNIYIQEFNLGRSAQQFIETINPKFVYQYHIAGGEYNKEHNLIIDTHGTDISKEVFDLYKKVIDVIGLRPTLYERDNNIPAFDDLCQTVTQIRLTQKLCHKVLC